jgi:hypothetical protein
MTLPALLLIAVAIDFTIELDSAGGFFGRGSGAITISSEGWSRASSIGVIRRTGPQTPLTLEEIDALQAAVVAAIGRPWPASVDPPNDNGCCDRFKWTLRLIQPGSGAPILITTWHGGNERYLPRELAALHDLTTGILKRELAAPRRGEEP